MPTPQFVILPLNDPRNTVKKLLDEVALKPQQMTNAMINGLPAEEIGKFTSFIEELQNEILRRFEELKKNKKETERMIVKIQEKITVSRLLAEGADVP